MNGLSLLVSLPDEPASLDVLARELSWDTQSLRLARQLFDEGLPPLVDRGTLPYLFGVSPRLISAMGKFPERYYRRFVTPKHGGGQRQIDAPRRFVKLIQRWINQHVLASAKLPPYVLGFAKGRNIFDHGRLHADSTNLMVVDIQDFFPTITFDNATAVFCDFGFPTTVALQLGSLCSLDRRLPQGAPTSPSIANLAFSHADSQLKALANSWDSRYSRYADDLAFSGSTRYTKTHVRRVETILKRHGFAVNTSKTRRIGSGARQIVTGLVINKVAHPPRWKRHNWRAMFHRAQHDPRQFAQHEQHMRGVAAFVSQYDPARATRYRAVIETVARLSSDQ